VVTETWLRQAVQNEHKRREAVVEWMCDQVPLESSQALQGHTFEPLPSQTPTVQECVVAPVQVFQGLYFYISNFSPPQAALVAKIVHSYGGQVATDHMQGFQYSVSPNVLIIVPFAW
jgi:hypothetical protein